MLGGWGSLPGWVSREEEAKRGVAGALLLGEALGEARAQARGECVPDRLADPPTIANILTSFNQSGIAPDLWDDSLEDREEYWCIIQFITPITRLPIELLHQIFLAIIEEMSDPPLALMLVCKQWHAIVISIWSSLNLGTRTPIDAVARKLERNQWLLDVVVDTNSDRGDFTPSDGDFEAIFVAIVATPRWRSCVVESFPAPADLPEALVNLRLQQHSQATMSRFTTFRIKSSCETLPLLNSLLHILGTTAGPALTTVEINSPNVISFLLPLILPSSILSKSSLSTLWGCAIQWTFYLTYINSKHLLWLISFSPPIPITLNYHLFTHSVISVSELLQFSG